jgi:predicted nucleic acid-binding protein
MSVFVLDACVLVSLLRTDANHVKALAALLPLVQGLDSMVVPALFEVEVTAALARAGAGAQSHADFARFLARAKVVTLGPRAARAAAAIARTTRLRGADAIYVWTAKRAGLKLVTFDAEILQRAVLVGVTAAERP